MVTLTVPVYNMEQHLPRCMESLLHQTCRDYEILLIDDGSTDSSGALCDEYAAIYPELVRVVHKPNGGLSSARNAGIAHALGEFIVFPDPDDWVEPDYVAAFLEVQARYHADLVCLGHYVDTDSASIPCKPDAQMLLLSGSEAQRGLLLPPGMQGFSWNKLYRLEIIRTYGLSFPNQMGITEDLFFTYQYLAHCHTVCHVPTRYVYHYYQRENSSTRSPFNREKIHTIRTYEHIIADCAERDPILAHGARNEICTVAVNLLYEYEMTGKPDPEARAWLLSRVRQLLPGYLKQSRYGLGRKVQTLLTAVSPRLLMHLKKAVRNILR